MAYECFSRECWDQFQAAHCAQKPYKQLYAYGFPLVFAIPLVGVFLLMIGAVISAGIRGNDPRRNNQPPSVAGMACCPAVLITPIFWIIGSVALVWVRSKIDADFERRNQVVLRYPFPKEERRRYKRWLDAMDGFAKSELIEIHNSTDGYEQGSRIHFYVSLPKFIQCNCDVYCAAFGCEKFYFFPDGVLASTSSGYSLVGMRRVTTLLDDLHGHFNDTAYYLQWAHSRVDGGPDRRFKYNYQVRVPYKVKKPISQFGVISLTIGKFSASALSRDPAVARRLAAAFEYWGVIQPAKAQPRPERSRTHYDMLGLSRNATSEEIRTSYRALAMKYHPDRNPGDDDCVVFFKEITEAYTVLSDPLKRATYDRQMVS
jgi:hypothetical protein